jgi:uncharacterized protein YjbJ (UPF0337 family)
MKSSTKDRMEGKYHEVKGKVKEVVGETVKSTRLTMEGQKEKIAGKVQEKVGQAKKVLGK